MMNVEFPHAHHLSAEEQQELETLRTAIEKAIADGILTQEERDNLLAIMRADHKITFEELELIRVEIQERINRGELIVDYS